VAVKTEAIGKTYPAVTYAVGREKIREYASAVGETNALYFDVDAAREAGHADVVAPPMFAVVYSAGAVAPGILDPEVGINLGRMLHGSQEFAWGEPVVAGDVIETSAKLLDMYEKDGREFYVFESVSRNQNGQEVVRGTWTNIVR
jgi:acyl dehydratase